MKTVGLKRRQVESKRQHNLEMKAYRIKEEKEIERKKPALKARRELAREKINSRNEENWSNLDVGGNLDMFGFLGCEIKKKNRLSVVTTDGEKITKKELF